MIKKKIPIVGMHCTSCAMLIEGELEDIGVKAHCSYATEQVEVEYDDANISAEDVVAAVKKAGYSVKN